jgi:hypothetical protein
MQPAGQQLLTSLLSAVLLAGCAPKFRQIMLVKADGTQMPVPLPKRCASVPDLQLKNRDLRQLLVFITKQNHLDWRVDNRRHTVCLQRLITYNDLGLFRINSVVSSHWNTCYFINGSRGVSVIRWTGAGQAVQDVGRALARHRADFSAAQADSLLHYFDK